MAARTHQTITTREWLALLIGVAAVSWAAPLIRLAEAPALVIAALRMTVAAPPLAAAGWALRRDELRRVARGDLVVLAIAGLALAAHFAFWVAGVQRTSVVASTAIVATQPLFVGFGGWLLLGERPTRALLLGAAIAAGGALLLASEDLGDADSLRGDLFSAFGAAFAGVYLIAGRRVRPRLSNLSYAAVVNVIAALVLLRLLFASDGQATGQSNEAYLYIVLLALVPQLIGHGSLTWALGSLPAAIVAVALLGEPVGATAIGATVLDELPTLLEWLGATVLLAGVYVALRGGLRPAVEP